MSETVGGRPIVERNGKETEWAEACCGQEIRKWEMVRQLRQVGHWGGGSCDIR